MKQSYFAQTLNCKVSNLKILVCVCFLLIHSFSFGAGRFWVSSSPSNWNNKANWSATCGGKPGASVPAAIDEVVFDDGGNGNCLLDIEVRVMDLELSPSYSGTLIQISNAISIAGNATFYGGGFVGGSDDITIMGKFQLSGTNFISTSGVLELKAEAWFGEGQFDNNRGTVRLNKQESFLLTGNNPKFYILDVAGNEKEYMWTPVENAQKESRSYMSDIPQNPSRTFTH